ncbi:sigma-70 family RNA polymerase sigma factor [Halomonas sp. LY9]
MRPRLLAFARLQLRDAAAAEDAVQETLLTAFEKSATFEGRSEFETWVFGILKFKILDQLRHQKKQGRWQPLDDDLNDDTLDRLFEANGHWQPNARPSDWGQPEQLLENQRFWQVFDACMLALPDNVARIFSLRELMGLSTEEICKETGVSDTNCWVILHRARLRLRECLESGWVR